MPHASPLRPLVLGMVVLVAGCAAPVEAGTTAEAPLEVYATTGYLADAVANIAPDARVTTMVGPGGDPHTYQPSTRDVARLSDADVVLWNGLGLEAQMIDQLVSLGDRQLAVADQLDADLLLAWPDAGVAGEPLYDPHVWNSPEAWTAVVHLVADHLGAAVPEREAEYRANAEAYASEIEAAVEAARARLDTVPEPRVLVTGHDAFAYVGQAYGLEVHATDFLSTEAQLSAVEISELADLVAGRQVPAVFHDNQASPQAIVALTEAVRARGWDVAVADAELYADSLGADPGVDTYLGVLDHNSRTVTEALGGTP